MSKHPIGLGGSGAGSVTNSGTLTNNAGVFGAGTTVVKTDNSITTDGSGNLSAVSITTTGAGTGTVSLTTGAMGTGSAGTVLVGANTGNVLSVSAAGGAVTAVALVTSPTLTTPTFSGNIGGTVQIGTQAITSQYANAGATGTTLNLLAKVNASGQVLLPAITDQADVLGICMSGCGTAGNSQIAVSGQATCVADNTVTAGDYIGVGTTTSGRCKSLSAAGTYPGATLQVLGRAITGASAAATFTVQLYQTLQTPAAAAVSSVFTRTGAVVATSGDYSLDKIGAPLANASFALSANTVTFTGGVIAGSPATNVYSILDTTANTTTGALLSVNTVGTSTALPLKVTGQGTSNGISMSVAGALTAIGTGSIRATVFNSSDYTLTQIASPTATTTFSSAFKTLFQTTNTGIVALQVQTTQTTPTVAIFNVTDNSGNNLVSVDKVGHLTMDNFGTTAPTVTANCGTSPSFNTGASDHAFTLNIGTGGTATTCTVSFHKTFTNAPTCVVSDDGGTTVNTLTTTTTTVIVTASVAWAASRLLNVICFGG